MELETGAPAEVVPDAPAVDVPAVETPAEPAKPLTRAETIREALNTPAEERKPTNRGKHAVNQPREQGKFAPGAPVVADPVQAPVVSDRPPMLKSLRKEVEAHWNNAPPELLNEFTRREADYEKGVAQYRTQAQQAAEVLDQFKPYEWILRNEGSTPQQAIAPLLQTAAILRTGTPQQKAQSVAQMMQQFGIPMDHIAQMFGAQTQGQQVADPQYNALAQQVQQLTQHITQSQYQQQQALEGRALSVIQQFAQDPKNIHFEALQDTMLRLLQAPQVLGDTSGLSEREKLQLAYDTAVRLDPNIAAQSLAQQQAAQAAQVRGQAQNAVQTAKAAAVQVRGAPGSAAPANVDPKNRRDVIANALRAAL